MKNLYYAFQHGMDLQFVVKHIENSIVYGGEYDKENDSWNINACDFRLELVKKKEEDKLETHAEFKAGDRVKVKDNESDQTYAKNFCVPNEFVIKEIRGDIAYTQGGTDIGTWRLELVNEPSTLKKAIEQKLNPEFTIQFKVGQRVKFKSDHLHYADLHNLPYEFVVAEISEQWNDPQLIYADTNSVGCYSYRLELVDAPVEIEEENQLVVTSNPEYTQAWGVFSKLTGELCCVESTRKQARWNKSDLQTVKKIEYRIL